MALISPSPSRQQRPVHSRSSALPVRILGGISQMIGTVSVVLMSENLVQHSIILTYSFPRWIYAQFIAIDANFKLKLKNRRINDPELGSGWSYFVENSAYTSHVAKNPHQEDVRISIPLTISLIRGYFLMPSLGYELRQRISRRQPSEFTWWKGLYCDRCC